MGMNSVEKTNQLSPGMLHPKAVKVMGKPKSIQFVGDKVILKYNLHQYWKGWVPYYLVFSKGTGRLQSWYADEEEYQRNQQAWMQAYQAFEASQSSGQGGGQASSAGGEGSSGGAGYVGGYDPNANYYTNDSYWQGSGYSYSDYD